MMTVIREGAVGRLGDTRVGMNNMERAHYMTADGEERDGLCAALFVGPDMFVVGEGSAVEIAGQSWQVTAIEQIAPGFGSITLRRN